MTAALLEIAPGLIDGIPALRLAGPLVQGQDMVLLRDEATRLLGQNQTALVVDLRTLSAVDFAGLGALLELRRVLGPSGRLYLLGTSASLRGMMARAQIDTVFTLVPDADTLHRVLTGDARESS